MRERLLSAVLGLGVAALLSAPGAAAQVPLGDSVIGSGTLELGGSFEIDARSGPSGESPTGTLTVRSANGEVFFSGDVRCMAVDGNVANLQVFTSPFGLFDVTVFDLSGAGPGFRDLFQVDFATGNSAPPACSSSPLRRFTFTVETGDIVIVDAPPLPTTREQCTNGGWRNYPGFKNQGDCTSFVATAGKNPPAG